MMVKALCCHTFARQNLFSPAARPTAITAAGSWAVVASEERWIRVYDLEQEPGTLTAAFPSIGRVKALTLCREENFIAALESDPRSPGDLGRTSRCVRVYRNFWRLDDAGQEAPRARNATQPPSPPLPGSRLDVLQFSSLHAPAGIAMATDSPARLMAAVGHSVWVAAFSSEKIHFDLLFTIAFSFPVCRLALLQNMLAVGSMDEVHVVRVCDSPPNSRFDDEVILPTLAKERRDLKTSGRAMEVLGPTVDFDSASARFSSTAQPKRPAFIETMLYRRFPASSNTRVHTLQLFSDAKPHVFVATTFEGFLYRLGEAVERRAEYAFSERTLQARVGSDFLLHVITNCGLNTYTTRSGDLCCYPVPEQFPICMIGSLVWREINMRCLLAWTSGLLLYTEKDNLYTLYSLQFQPIDHLFSDMLQSARQYASDSVLTSCHILCEAFHLHSLRDVAIDRDKTAVLVEFHMNALPNLHLEHLKKLFEVGQFDLDDVMYVCEKLKEKDVDWRCFLRLYTSTVQDFAVSVQAASEATMQRFYPLLMESDHEEYIRSILLRNDRNWFTAREDLLTCVPLDSPEALLLACLFLFETSRVDEIEALIHRGNETAMRDVLTRFPHLLVQSRTLTDFGMFLCLIAPRMVNEALLSLMEEEEAPDNLPQCCLLLLYETRFARDRSLQRLLPAVDALLDLLTAGQPPTLQSPRPAKPAVCPHKSLRCRHVDSWLLERRISALDSLPPFRGVSPVNFGSHRASSASCACLVCHAHLLRLQGLLCFSLKLPDASDLFARLQQRCADMGEYSAVSLTFLAAHRCSVVSAFPLIAAHDLSAAVAYLRKEAGRVGGPEQWAGLAGQCEVDSERQWAVVRTAVAELKPHEGLEMVERMGKEGREEEMQTLVSGRYAAAIADQLFASHVDDLAC